MAGVDITELDAHEQPSAQLKAIWKSISRTDQKELLNGDTLDDIQSPKKLSDFVLAGQVSAAQLEAAFRHVLPDSSEDAPLRDVPIYVHHLIPGLLIIPSLVPAAVQKALLSKVLHRDLSCPRHLTNLHLHFDVPYRTGSSGEPQSFFSYPRNSPVKFEPKDPSVHRPLSIEQVLERKLHWVTLGGQYDWTNRVYPDEVAPEFPEDVAAFLGALFPETRPEAAIVNFYTPGDTMMMHRDVSEETGKGLVSISFGCDALFMITPDDVAKTAGESASEVEQKYLLLRIRSGDAIYMTKESRFAWHGVPKVLKGTCPDYLRDWPADGEEFGDWRGWMANKRININVRQMKD